MSDVLSNLTSVLEFCLNIFTSIMTWTLSNPILAISIYIPLSFFLIALVFKLVSNLLSKKGD